MPNVVSSVILKQSHLALVARKGTIALTGLSIAFLAGCASAPPPPPRPSMVIQQPPVPPAVQAHPLNIPRLQEQTLPPSGSSNTTTNTPPQPVQTASTPAVLALVSRAEQQTKTGDLSGAEATLERAVQIQPHNARLWLDFAKLRLAQNQPAQAEQFALRAVQYAQNNQQTIAAWQMVAKARDAQGNTKGADDARRRAGFVSNSTQG